jgi:hypothetical protein
MEGADKKQKRVALMIKGKTDICNRLERGKKIRIKYNVLISGELRYLANLWSRGARYRRFYCILFSRTHMPLKILTEFETKNKGAILVLCNRILRHIL